MTDNVNSPGHYITGNFETIDVIEAWLSSDEAKGYRRGNVIKYVSRAGRKDSYVEDLRKARWYLDREIARHEREQSPGRVLVGDQVKCIDADDMPSLADGWTYRVAATSGGSDMQFVTLEGLPARYYDVTRFEVVE